MKQQILLCLLVATIVLTSYTKKEIQTPIDPSAFVGKWVGQLTIMKDNEPPTITLDTLILEIDPDNSTQLINTFKNTYTIYKVTDSNNYIVEGTTINGTFDGGHKLLVIQSDFMGVLINPTTLRETGNITSTIKSLSSNSIYIATYTKQ